MLCQDSKNRPYGRPNALLEINQDLITNREAHLSAILSRLSLSLPVRPLSAT